MKSRQVLGYAVVLVLVAYLFDYVIQYVGRPSNRAYSLIWILLSCPVFTHLTYHHQQQRFRNVILTIITAAVLNLVVALAVTVTMGGWGSLAGYLASYALPTLMTMLPTWIVAVLLGGMIGVAIHRMHHRV